ncbi:pentatricopeptide repeat-containing protein DOT4, chloroplastic-like [Gastrolobium bilobum]|uniref:pentatricopeptide repeat-containing protein DOT4, chloroplastic-like n=1 Tax=Gastrolobium bilobum TaxID=150636 RepID=UPI002AAF907F|nr:pentatricopeptide repeat-containing protein DOT4, chloroplastic-like [Gastrolobium bilobum]
MDILQSATILRFFPSEKFTPTFVQISNNPRYLRRAISLAPTSLSPHLFDEIPLWDTFAWNTLIQTHLANNDCNLVLSTYTQMLQRGVRLDRHTLPRVVDASRLMGDLSIGKQLHGHALKLGFSSDQYAVTALIEMYGHLGSVDLAQTIFDKSTSKNLVCWTLLARLYIDEGKPSLALDLFHQMVDQGMVVDPVALSMACSACGMMKSLQHGRNVHEIARNCGLEFDVLVSNSLLKVYIDCGSIREARLVFEQMPSKDVISWTMMIRAYVKKGGFNEAFKLFRKMNLDGLKPDSLSISSILPACGRIASLKHGREIHAYLLRNGINSNLKVKNAVMDMYVKSGAITCASNIFSEMNEKDTISWTMMILGYSLHGQGKLGVDLFRQIENNSKVQLDDHAYAAALHACSTARMAEEGKIYFNRIRAPTIAHCALKVSLLARCGLFNEARIFIEEQKIGKHPEVLRKLLEGCRIHGQYTLGKQLIEQLCELEPLNAENYVLLLNWYAASAKWHVVDKLKETIRDMGLKPKKAYTWTLFRNKVHVFGTGDVSHPRSGIIYSALQGFMEEMRTKGLELKWDFSLHDVDEERECIQIGHSELLALAFGLISSQAGPIRLVKNSRVCHGCHDFAKFVSKMMKREIILKDPNFFHHFKDGHCTCEDFC